MGDALVLQKREEGGAPGYAILHVSSRPTAIPKAIVLSHDDQS
jgi:hypothetical protein